MRIRRSESFINIIPRLQPKDRSKDLEKELTPPKDQFESESDIARDAAVAAWKGQSGFLQPPGSSPNQADRVDAASSRRQPVSPSTDRADPFRRRWLDTLLDTNMDRSGIGRPVKLGPQPIKPHHRGLLDALREALDDKDRYSDALRGPVAI